jgi:hypothetical protein
MSSVQELSRRNAATLEAAPFAVHPDDPLDGDDGEDGDDDVSETPAPSERSDTDWGGFRIEFDESAGRPYPSDWDYLHDELRLLDLRIQRRIRQQSSFAAESIPQFPGLVISPEEVDRLLRPRGAATHAAVDNDPVRNELSASIARQTLAVRSRRQENALRGPQLRFLRFAQRFRLTEMEQNIVLILLAPEVDRKYDKLFAFLQDDVTRRRPGIDVVLNLLCETARERLAARHLFLPREKLRANGIIDVFHDDALGQTPLISRFLKLDDGIVEHLLGDDSIDHRLRAFVTLGLPSELTGPALADEQFTRMRAFLRQHFDVRRPSRRPLVFRVSGPAGSGTREFAERAAGELEMPLLTCQVPGLLASQVPLEDALLLLARECRLRSAALCFDGVGEQEAAPVEKLLAAAVPATVLTLLLSRRPLPIDRCPAGALNLAIDLSATSLEQRLETWNSELRREDETVQAEAGALAGKFCTTPGRIHEAVSAARDLAAWRAPGDPKLTPADLYAACHAQSSRALEQHARRIKPSYTLGQIVLPEEQKAQLDEICNQAAYRHVVFGAWKFGEQLALGKGLNVLFSGPPGTGKTMAADILAGRLNLELYKIDLSQVVSKFIGETEKNLKLVFDEARACSAVLFFDEADALFGKRSEVKDSHDRYANLEISYLLQKMEEYEGVSILATNLRKHLDDAFLRRIQFVVEFPFPGEADRRRIWAGMFPRAAPLGDVDFDWLASRFPLAGGNIKNIVLNAAFLAAAAGGPIGMPHLLRAARSELQKLGRVVNEPDFRPPDRVTDERT